MEYNASLKVMLAKISSNLQNTWDVWREETHMQTPRPGAPVWALSPKFNMLVRMWEDELISHSARVNINYTVTLWDNLTIDT